MHAMDYWPRTRGTAEDEELLVSPASDETHGGTRGGTGRVSSFMVHGESSGQGCGHADRFVGECSAAGRGHSSLGFHGDASVPRVRPPSCCTAASLDAVFMDTRAASSPSFDGMFQGKSRGQGAAGDANGAGTADLLRTHVRNCIHGHGTYRFQTLRTTARPML